LKNFVFVCPKGEGNPYNIMVERGLWLVLQKGFPLSDFCPPNWNKRYDYKKPPVGGKEDVLYPVLSILFIAGSKFFHFFRIVVNGKRKEIDEYRNRHNRS